MGFFKRRFHFSIILIYSLNFHACDKISVENEIPLQRAWEKVNFAHDNFDVRSIKAFNGRIYVAGGDVNAAIFHSVDGYNFQTVFENSFNTLPKITAITQSEGKLYFTGNKVGVFEYSDGKGYKAISDPSWGLLGEPSDIHIYNGQVFISGVNSQYPIAILRVDGSKLLIGDSLNPDCSKSLAGGIRQSSILKLQSGFINGKQQLIGCTNGTNRYLYSITDSSVNCFDKSNLSESDIYYGAHDFTFSGDSILSGGYAVVKTYSNGGWHTFGDSLPDTPQKFKPYVTAIAVMNGRVFVGTNYLGVLEWIPGVGWKILGEGLPKFQDGFFDSVNHLAVFQNILFAGFGTGKPWASSSKGVYRITL